MCQILLYLRDYFSDVEAVVSSKNPSFRVTSLTIWDDLVQPQALPTCVAEDSSADALAATEAAAASRFQECRIKLAQDCSAMNKFISAKAKTASKLHVAKVLHEKAQNEAGKKFLGNIHS